jgi:hypothetical protein
VCSAKLLSTLKSFNNVKGMINHVFLFKSSIFVSLIFVLVNACQRKSSKPQNVRFFEFHYVYCE